MTITDIRKKNLEKALDENVFRQINSQTIIFLSQESQNNLLKYIDNQSSITQEDVKNLWKNLLIDSISFLKLNDKREKINKETLGFVQESSFNFNEKFNSIRKLSSYGIEDLAEYFSDFINFESVLYGSDDYYRDHVDHVLRVWGIGIGLLNEQIENFKFFDNAKYFNDNFSFSTSEEDILYLVKGEVFAMWTIIALCHDLGYPIEKSSKINNKLRKILNHFGQIDIEEFSYNFGLFNNYLVEKFLNISASKPFIDEHNKKYTLIQSKYRDKISKSLEDYKHGVFSALLIFKTLTYFLETDYSYEKNESLLSEDLRQFYIRKEILRAITAHTCPKLYHVDLNTLPFLLILCDELQEWGRPRFQDLKQGSIHVKEGQNPKIFIQEFNFVKDASGKYTGNIEVRFEYSLEDFEKNKTNYEKRIRDKFQMFHHLLRSAKDDEKRTSKFIWAIEFNNDTVYKFIFDSEKDSYNVIQTPIIKKEKGVEKSIPEGYLEIYENK